MAAFEESDLVTLDADNCWSHSGVVSISFENNANPPFSQGSNGTSMKHSPGIVIRVFFCVAEGLTKFPSVGHFYYKTPFLKKAQKYYIVESLKNLSYGGEGAYLYEVYWLKEANYGYHFDSELALLEKGEKENE